MAGEYGEIDSRAAFYRQLGEADNLVQNLLAQNPGDELMELIFEELLAMRRWSDAGRVPTDQERGSINIGLLAAREISQSHSDLSKLAQILFALNNYFEDWPTDEQAAHAPEASTFQLR
jgi:hypothetical protein